jgi:hypothetical protein
MVYCRQPTGFKDPARPTTSVFFRALCMHGLRQAPRAWFERFVAHAISIGFKLANTYRLVLVRLSPRERHGLSSPLRRRHGPLGLVTGVAAALHSFSPGGLCSQRHGSHPLLPQCRREAEPRWLLPLSVDVHTGRSGVRRHV